MGSWAHFKPDKSYYPTRCYRCCGFRLCLIFNVICSDETGRAPFGDMRTALKRCCTLPSTGRDETIAEMSTAATVLRGAPYVVHEATAQQKK
jgi:hypothetical protein